VSIKIKGSPNGLTRQPDSEISEEIDYTMKGQIVFEGDKQYQNNAPQIGTPHPDDNRLHCYARRRQFPKLGKIKIICDYIGLMYDPTPPVWEMIGTLSEDPIETHQNFVDKIGGNLGNEKNNAYFDPDTGEFVCFPADAPQDLGGVRGYLVPSVVWRKTWWSSTAPQPSDLGVIIQRPVQLALPQSVKNGLGSNFTYRQVGFYFQVSEEVMGSGKKGWNTLIYA
jgi:hypothetical protein